MNKNAIVLITKIPSIEYLDFLNTFTQYDMYVIIDSNEYITNSIKSVYKNIEFIQINENECRNKCFCNSSYLVMKKDVTGWDKALYYFSIINTKYNNIWFIEDDIFFYGETTLLNIDEKYKEADLLCNCDYSPEKLNEWMWDSISIQFPAPYYAGMMCCSRMSNKLLECFLDYSSKNKTLFFLEALFPTLAKHYNLNTIQKPTEFISVKCREKSSNYNKTDLYHPNKDITEHNRIRKCIDSNEDIRQINNQKIKMTFS